ncbi:hypothetical protein GOBAR_AA22024 [Gossypium barbadense]|uniref:Uncharacterized protein n=1 Tax=Gossypium barbadense TaxID=3634 RepID=A0A2P5X5M5_GOSBA|nr:hypothetical protein GOBAR_AA22024 [Gossypium barbadense]
MGRFMLRWLSPRIISAFPRRKSKSLGNSSGTSFWHILDVQLPIKNTSEGSRLKHRRGLCPQQRTMSGTPNKLSRIASQLQKIWDQTLQPHEKQRKGPYWSQPSNDILISLSSAINGEVHAQVAIT